MIHAISSASVITFLPARDFLTTNYRGRCLATVLFSIHPIHSVLDIAIVLFS
jgi:hypothetical protein